ncbi:hypothetical protein M2323_000014 [Rhodoblastus acidophilus]|uniref:hypothetical protein n=1 Tax=Rhodoblastus acidophilus TaxID=1074 RepID=UPI002224D6BD|nr:hypothetical protein [Rhodoblastus acidophilus]MCW2282479.1 hypothetical protein [Rhodoblastus acidophilus]MCW2331116.1 hypothetical protein [Rhodoblastus acidophilus]
MISFRSPSFVSLALLVAAPALAQAADISLDNVSLPTGEHSKITFKHIDLVDTNLTTEEANKLFSGALSREAVADLVGKLKAARIAVNEATATSDKPGSIVFRDLTGEGIDQGAIAHLSLGGVDADIPGDTGGAITFKSQKIAVDGVQIRNLAEAIKTGQASAAQARISRAAWGGFDLSAPDKDTPAGADGGNLIRIHLNSAEAEQSFDGDTPAKSSFVASGFSVAMPKASQAGATLTALGYDKIEATMKFAGAYQAATKTFVLDDYSLDFAKLGSIGVSAKLGGVEKAAFGGDAAATSAAIQASEVQSVQLKLVNAGALEKAVALTALSKSQTPDAVKADWSMIAAQGPLLAPNIPAAATLSQGLLKFIANGKNLTLSFNAKAPAPKISELQGINDPAQVVARFDVAAAADGSAPPLTAPAAPSSTLAQAAEPAPAQKLTGLAAWSALVGNTVSGKDSDGLPLSEFYAPNGVVKQLDDDETATGKWIVRGENVCFIFPGEKEETCYKVEVAGDIATFIDEDGDGKRYTILKGNAKSL